MKHTIKTIVSTMVLALAALALPQTAVADPAQGTIYSIDLVSDGVLGGKVPSAADPLRVGERAVIRVRLANANWSNPSRQTNPRPWRIAQKTPTVTEYYPLQLGISLGGEQAYADYVDTREVSDPVATYTDFFFVYTVKAGDLALPAYLMDASGKPAGETGTPEYALLHKDLWTITNDDGTDLVGDGLFHFTTQGGAMPSVPGEPQNYSVSGRGMGLYAQTVDFDKNYAEPAETEGETDIWRKVYEGMTTTTTILPSIAVEGVNEANVFMYVWSEDPNVAALLKSDGAKTVTDVIGGVETNRTVLPVLVPQGATTVSFKLKGVAQGQTKVMMSSSEHLVEDDMHVLVMNWVERTVQVVEAPAPFVSVNLIDPAGNPLTAPVTCSADYENYAAALVVTLSKPCDHAVKVNVNPTVKDDEVDVFGDVILGMSLDSEGTPWVNTDQEVTFNAGETAKTIYIYALGSSPNVSSYGIKFTPTVSDPSAYPGDAKTANLVVKYAKPTIESPTPADAITDAMAGQSYTLNMMLTDAYRDLRHDDGYTVKYRISIGGAVGTWETLDEQYFDPDTGMGEIEIAFEDEGEGTLEIYVINADKQDSRVKGKGVVIPVTVAGPKKAWAELDHPDGYYAEGETAKVKFFVSQKTPGSKVYYAFLVPVNDDATNKFASTGFSVTPDGEAGKAGCPFAPGSSDTGSGVAEVTCLDGNASGQYDVFICTQPTYAKTKSAGYSAGRLIISATNVCPYVVSVDMGGQDVTQGMTTPAVAQGVKKTFRVSIGETEPSQRDKDGVELPDDGKDHEFWTQWKFGTESLDWETVKGNPDLGTTVTNHVFASPGNQVVKVRVQDKDMRANNKWSPEFTFTVPVLDVPRIEITPKNGTTYEETATGDNASHFDVTLTAPPTFANGDDRLVVELTVEKIRPELAYSADDCVLSKQKVEFRSGVMAGQSFYLQDLDGTSGSAAGGFRIKAKATAESMAKDTEGKTWDVGEVEIQVMNVKPTIMTPAEVLDKDGKPIPQVTTVGSALSLAWAISDVAADTNGMSVTWTTSEGVSKVYKQGEEGLADAMTGSHEFTFLTSGEKSITILVQDKDGGVDSRTIYYTIAASKTLEAVAHGPSTGNGTPLSARYHDKASGLGAGRVWAKNFALYDMGVFTFNCGLDASWRVYGAGLTNGEETVTLNAKGEEAYRYTYLPEDGKDSFLYCWLQIVQEQDAAKPTDEYLAIAPEHVLERASTSGTLVSLPKELDKDSGSYPKAQVEAIFAKEYLKSDNMGDINQDGIPDIYAKKYDFGIFDESGEVTGDDLKHITVENENGNIDADFLPSTGTSALGTLIPGLAETWVKLGQPFDAKTEIRGYHDGLNDAPTLAGVVNVRPDRVYCREDGTWSEADCTISELEFLAWKVYAAGHGLVWTNSTDWTKWSPERPTDPCVADTDDDGFTDGYEYYFWYKAHVGYLDADGTHRYLSGRIFDPRNPGQGRYLPSVVLARLMDPRSDLEPVDEPMTAADRMLLNQLLAQDAATRDSDNDGLPDLLEFAIGTNPFDFDSDGDGLPDGFEILLNGTDPLNAYTTKGICDAMRNYDGDAMAFTTPELEEGVMPKPMNIESFVSFATVNDAFTGDSDGVQWYVGRSFEGADFDLGDPEEGHVIQVKGERYFTALDVRVTEDGRLATDLTALGAAWKVVNAQEKDVLELGVEVPPDLDYIRLAPARLAVGTQLELIEEQAPVAEGEEPPAEPVMVQKYVVDRKASKVTFASTYGGLNAAWIYGSDIVSTETTANNMLNLGGFGMLAMGRYLDVEEGEALAELPSEKRPVALMHYLVYQEFGFDPRTAWNAHTPLAARWGSTVDGEVVESQYNSANGYAGIATRTREFTAYDEFLLLSFWLENGTITDADVTATQANPWYKIWSKYTTNPQGPGELWEPDNENFKGRTAETASDTNGADTDQDGVPDGWELYVMAGPKVQELFGGLKFNFAGPYNDRHFSHFGPFEADAASASWTDANGTSGYDSLPGDNDGLTELREFAGTDSCNWYSKPQQGNEVAFSTTIVRPDADAKWLNKFFPTDPWAEDTDKDGIPDGRETSNWSWSGTTAHFKCGNFVYGTPVDNGSTCIPGGGLNPLTIDTDGDGLPDLWEAQFAGSKIYDGPEAELTKDADGKVGNPKQGLCDGMDGTVNDAFTYPITVKKAASAGGTNNYEITYTSANGMKQVVDRDYDHDGLQNWQEYLTGMMRCWRYDDPLSRWDAIPEDVYYKVDENGKATFDASAAAKKMFPDDENPVARFWYETLVNVTGEWYNPHLITGMNPANYMSRVTNPWDKAFTDEGSYYWMVDRIGETTLDALWCDPNGKKSLPLAKGMSPVPLKYACCSPIDPDSDHDGLDDYYELFHGMNPLLGASGVLSVSSTSDSLNESAGPCDLVYDAWYKKGVGALEAWAKSATDEQANYWQRDAGLKAKHDARFAKGGVTPPENGYDFEVYPWLNGLQMADPDGDDIRNLYESIQPKLSGAFYLHTDPTPLWMTDSTYSNSLVRLFFRLPARPAAIELARDSFEYDGTPYFYRDFDGFQPAVPMVSPAQLVAYTIDKWSVTGDGYNWMYSFEENEGYDSDHDFVSDYEEAQGTKRAASDPQDADSPRHRQAMYFPGMDSATGKGSVLQSLPEELEKHPLGVTEYPDAQLLQTFTIECWIKPDVVDPNVAQTVLERAVWVGASQVADKEYMRKNFQIAIRNGKWYVKYDTNGTEPTDSESGKTFEYYSPNEAVTSRWTHVAATFDGSSLTVFVDGVANAIAAHLSPANAVSALVLHNEPGSVGDYWYAREYACHAFVIGASLRGSEALGPNGYEALDITRCIGWNAYHEFFRGYVDEVRVWDGARASDDVINDYNNRKRYDRTDVLANREAVYEAWQLGRPVPELLHHWTFDSVAGAENAEQVAQWPRGFGEGDCPAMSRPDGYVIDWWKKIVDVFGSAYAGKLDWITWIPDTVGHLPRYDGTTLDSAFWSSTYAGSEAGEYAFPMTAEPVTRWTQMTYGGVDSSLMYQSTGLRHRLVNEQLSLNMSSTDYLKFEFTGRNRTCSGTDLLPLGGAYVKYVDAMWDDQGASSTWELTGGDANANGLPDWWEAYADQNYRPEDLPPDQAIAWATPVVRQGVEMTAGEAYLRDLAAGMYVDAVGKIVNTHVEDGKVVSGTAYAQTAKSDGLIPDWWKDLFKISGADPLDDGDYDGLNNYHEYVASELLPFSLRLDPLAARSDKVTLDYFQKVGKLYVGEMLTDHDLMEDGWERSLGDVLFADATVWDALKDNDGDGWTTFDENRYNGYRMSTLAQLITHKVGDVEARDFPVPVINLKVVYHGNRVGAVSAKAEDAKSPSGQGGQEKASGSENLLIVRTFTDGDMMKGDAKYSVQPGAPEDKYVYVGGWEDRKVYGAMSPGHVDIRSVKIEYFDMGNNNGTYTWKSKTTGQMHSKRPYTEYKAALDAGDVDTASLLIDSWALLSEGLPGTDQSMIPTIELSREPLLQIGYVDINRKRICTLDLDSGEFAFDMTAMRDALQLSDPNVSVENAIFRVRYTSMVPNLQNEIVTLSLATPDSGFVRGGKNAIEAFYDLNGDGLYTAGEPYGILRDVEIGWSGRELEIELTDMTAVSPRVDLWSSASDRAALTVGANDSGAPEVVTIKTTETYTTNGITWTRVVDQVLSNGFENVIAPAQKTTVNVSRYYIDGVQAEKAGLNGIEPLVFRQAFDSETRMFLHEGDFLKDGALDIDWGTFDAVTAFMRSGRPTHVYDLTNVTYLVTFEEPADMSLNQPSNQTVKSLATLITRRFERERTVPTPTPVSMVFETARPTFAWKIEGEDDWASKFGTTYTAFKVVVKKDLPNDKSVVYDSGVRRLPAKDRQGVYTWTAPLYVNSVTEKGVKFENLANYTWEVALYNAKFSDDAYMSVEERGNPFCAPQKFRMNVTTQDTSSRQVAVGVSYAGPAKSLKGKVRVQAFETPDFTGEAVAEVTVDAVGQTVTLIGLSEGSYFLRAYIDTNGNGVRDYWESWGYLCERDRANKPGLFNPVMAEAKFSPNTKDVRTVYIEDCDTNLNYFPDVWEAEQNGGKFDPAKIPPVDGNAELIGANPNLASTLSSGTKKASLSSALPPKMNSLASVPGVALMTGADLDDVVPTAGGFEIKSEVDPETLTIVGLNVDAAKNRVIVKVGAETTANVDSAVASFLNVTVTKGAEVTIKVEMADSPNGPWTDAGVTGKVTVDSAGSDIEVKLDGELPAQGFFRAKIEEK